MAENADVDRNRTMQASGSLRRALPWLGHAARVVLGLVFLVAGVTKMVDPAEFARQIAGYGIIGEQLSAFAAPVLIAFETALGIALLAGFRLRVSILTGCALLIGFIAVEAYGMSRGRTESCGCFGAYVQRTPAEVIVEDLMFLLLGGAAWFTLSGWRPRRTRAASVAVIVAAIAAVVLAAASPRLPIDPYVTRLGVGRPVDALQLPGHLPTLDEGRYLVALFEVTSPDALDLAAQLDEIAVAPGGPDVLVLSPSSDEEVTAFRWSAVPEFDIHAVDRAVLKRLYRRLPLYFAVDSGRVVAVGDDAGRVVQDLLSSEVS